VNELAHGAVAHSELAGQVRLLTPIDDRRQQRGALAVRERRDSGQGLVEQRPALEVLLGVAGYWKLFAELGLVSGPATEHVNRGVVGDAVKPGANLADVGSAAQRAPGLQERLLHGVLSAGVVDEPPAVSPQLAPVAFAEGLERPFMTRPSQSHQSPIGLRAQQRGGQHGGHDA
jgi:hypothetical protein